MPLLLAQSIGIGSLGEAAGLFLVLGVGVAVACLHIGLYLAYTFPLVRSRLPLPEWRRFQFIPLVVLAAFIVGSLLGFLALRYENLAGTILFPAGVVTLATVIFTLRATREPQLAAVPVPGLVIILGMSLAGAGPGAVVFFGFIGWHFATLILTVIWRETRPSVRS